MRNICAVSFGFFAAFSANGQELKDPKTRDEDISGLSFSVKISRLSDAQYQYLYTVTNPAESPSAINDLYLDLDCPNMPDKGKQDLDNAGYTRVEDHSKDGRHVPVTSKVGGLTQVLGSITHHNVFRSFVSLPPGNTREIVVVSPNKPGNLPFKFTVPSTYEHEYDYLDESGEHWKYPIDQLPFYKDWEVHGIVKGPVCPENAATPLTRPVFSGQRLVEESRERDRLLQFEVKGNRNRWHDLVTTTAVKFRVYYDYGLLPASFKAMVNGRDVSSLFHPDEKIGSYEEVSLPLEGPRTLIEFTGCPASGDAEDGSFPPDVCDIDPFEIRRPIAP